MTNVTKCHRRLLSIYLDELMYNFEREGSTVCNVCPNRVYSQCSCQKLCRFFVTTV